MLYMQFSLIDLLTSSVLPSRIIQRKEAEIGEFVNFEVLFFTINPLVRTLSRKRDGFLEASQSPLRPPPKK
jgi:hypothetical protein